MIDILKIQHVFFDLDHTLWDFEKNSEATFKSIFEKLKFDFSLQNFLHFYNPINHFYWKLYRENKISETVLRRLRLKKTFAKMGITPSAKLIDEISKLYIERLSKHTHLFKDTLVLLEYLFKNTSFIL